MLDAADISDLVTRMMNLHLVELAKFDRIHDYLVGKLGRPEIPEDADAEVREIWKICVHNVLSLVHDAFTQNLSVVGYRSAQSTENAAGWDRWQNNRMDARQAEIYSSAVKYGVGYVVADGGVWRPRSPRQLLALYEDPQIDDWPQYALETWVDSTDAKPRRKGFLFDGELKYPLDLGQVAAPIRDEDGTVRRAAFSMDGNSVGEPVRHGGVSGGKPVCPVVRYVNRRDAEDLVEGEIERLIPDQRVINEVNFDRLIVARFGAFPQKVITGWTDTKEKLMSATARKTWTFDDDQVKAFTLAAASVDPYNGLIEKLGEHVAMRAQISPAYVTGKMVNLSAEALAAAEANQQRKLGAMRESHGESHEQLLGLEIERTGGRVDDSAEVAWKDTEARSFAAIVDGIYKLADAVSKGLPIEPFLPLVPGLSQQMIEGIKKKAQTASVSTLISSLVPAAASARQDPQVAALSSQTAPQAAALAAVDGARALPAVT